MTIPTRNWHKIVRVEINFLKIVIEFLKQLPLVSSGLQDGSVEYHFSNTNFAPAVEARLVEARLDVADSSSSSNRAGLGGSTVGWSQG